jgi:predicted 2-oxoglutarate/Fe(II)-dependent dioxygenase YbiX
VSASRNILTPGDPAPWFRAASNVNPNFDFQTVGGRFVVLSFLGAAGDPTTKVRFDTFLAEAALFSEADRYFFGVVLGAQENGDPHFATKRPGMDIFWDDGAISRRYGALPDTGDDFHPVTYLLSLDLRVLATARQPDPRQQASPILELLKRMPALGGSRGAARQAPVLALADVFEPELCKRLVAGYEANGGSDSGFMRDRDGKTVLVVDHKHKRRSDWVMNDEALMLAARERIQRRIVPEIEKAFHFKVTRMERYLVACYDAEVGGYFQPHRDNTTKGTAHRRFAVTINLNAEAYQGGDLMFPEYGHTTFRAPTGGAVVFSCGLLHQALPVTKGRRFCFLPFLYDEAAAKIREDNSGYLADNLAAYKAGR